MGAKITFGLVFTLLLILALFIRFRPINPDLVHADPERARRPSIPGHFWVHKSGNIIPPVFEISVTELRQRIEGIILDTPRTQKLAGDIDDFATYITRSALWGFPDLASVKVIDLGDGRSSIQILSRLYYGRSDFGVNEARVRQWLDQLEAF